MASAHVEDDVPVLLSDPGQIFDQGAAVVALTAASGGEAAERRLDEW